MFTRPIPRTETGNALFLILIAVVLFGALSYAITRSNNMNGTGAREEKASVLGSELLSYGSELSQAIMTLSMRGCDVTQISFENPNEPGRYVNPNAPSSKKCHVFDPAGGGVGWRMGPPGIRYDANYGQYSFVTSDHGAGNPLANIGTGDKADLYLMLDNWYSLFTATTKDLVPACEWINRQSGVSPVPGNTGNAPHGISNSWHGEQFVGVFNDGISPFTVGNINGQNAFCVTGPNQDMMFFYVLYAR